MSQSDRDLPLDPEAAQPGQVRYDIHTIPILLLLTFLGGMVGTFLRYEVVMIFPPSPLPIATFCVNMIGAFGLGVLMQLLLLRGPDEGASRMIRVALGTGCLGAFTTYSSLVLEIDTLAQAHHLYIALGYGLLTVSVGILATLLGMRVPWSGKHARQDTV